MDAVWAGKQPYSGTAHLKELSTPHLLIFWVRLHKYEDQKLFILLSVISKMSKFK